MEQLYRKREYSSGKVRYEPVHQWNFGDPADGIWFVFKNGFRWITEKIEDIPNPTLRFQLEQYRDAVCQKLIRLSEEAKSVDQVVTEIFKVLEGGKNE